MSFDALFEFESALAEYTGAPYAVLTDCATHAIELCFRQHYVWRVRFTAFTYLSIPQLFKKLRIQYELIDEQWTGEYRFHGSNIWDSARALYPDMYKPGQIQCLSFGHDKPMTLGRGGAILLDDHELYKQLKLMCYDGRDLNIQPWESQKEFKLGYHYKPTPEEALKGIQALSMHEGGIPEYKPYPDLRTITIK